jgi:glutathione S-transferase
MKDKTQWHKEINGGLVPMLELTDGTILLDSKVLMDYANEAYPDQGYSTLPKDPV